MPQLSPIHELSSRAGAIFINEADWLMPGHFGNPESEYRNGREKGALFDLSHRGKVEASGPDAAGFLQNLCTNDVKTLLVDHSCEAFFTTGQAKIVAHAIVEHIHQTDGADAFLLDLAPGTAGNTLKHLNYFLITEQVVLTDRTEDFAQFHLAGPHGSKILALAFAREIPELRQHQSLDGNCRIRRNDALSIPGFDLVCERQQAANIWQAICKAGAFLAGLQTYHALRIEAGTPLYGRDIDESNLPQEVGRTETAISFTKGCYIGQETIARIRTYGHVNQLFVGLKLAGETPAPNGCPLFHNEKLVGRVTSSVISPRRGVIALGYVRRGHHDAGTMLEFDSDGTRKTAEVISLPFAES
jgi:folate-binding protein YgfZ